MAWVQESFSPIFKQAGEQVNLISEPGLPPWLVCRGLNPEGQPTLSCFHPSPPLCHPCWCPAHFLSPGLSQAVLETTAASCCVLGSYFYPQTGESPSFSLCRMFLLLHGSSQAFCSVPVSTLHGARVLR